MALNANMDCFVTIPQRDNCCRMFCILKFVLFAMIIVFMLFLPLGDPDVACKTTSSSHTRAVMCFLCDGYFCAAKITDKTIQIVEYVLCVLIELVREAKLKFYALLERIDKRDLCGSVCCVEEEDPNSEEGKEIRCPHCKCVRRKCSRRSSKKTIDA